jgi:hypothetical protein
VGKPQVVITRKDKRLRKGWHLLAFMPTGGASAPVTAAKAGTNASYNARTRELQAQSEDKPVPPLAGRRKQAVLDRIAEDPQARWRAEHVPGSQEYRATH